MAIHLNRCLAARIRAEPAEGFQTSDRRAELRDLPGEPKFRNPSAWSRASALTMIRMGEYYSRRAGEYDATSWESIDEDEREAVTRLVAALPAGRIVDI